MSTNVIQNHPPDANQLKQDIRKRIIQVVLQWLITSAILFLSAGTLNWPMAWALVIVQAGVLAFNFLYLLPRNPEVVAERAAMRTGTKSWDKLIASVIGLAALGSLVVSGLDYRFAWTPPYALWINILGLACFASGNLLFSWALASNKFFATTVRIQDERGHSVASAGPYRYVRHPGYVGYILFSLATPVSLGTLWGLLPAGLVALGMVVRTALEDSALREELPGYPEYAARVRFRLLPGVW
jgi:protein-S-isoprenylcysteine O-methyltransferase Ste14